MDTIGVHPRVVRQHPEISPSDVVDAMRGMLGYRQRPSGEWLAIEVDGRNRLLELVYNFDDDEEFFFVYHAMTPPSKKTLRELGMAR